MLKNLFIFGLGYTGMALARAALAREWEVTATVRTSAKALNFAGFGGKIIALDHPQAYVQLVDAFRNTTHLLSTVPPDKMVQAEADPVLRDYGGIIGAAPRLEWAGYLSTTSVYGDTGGAWVTEESPPRPGTPRAEARLQAEREWLKRSLTGLPTHVFRLSGIYGPRIGNEARGPLAQLRAGTARRIDKPGHVMNRVHVDDIIGVLMASMMRHESGAVYNVSDDEPAPTADVIAYAAELLGVPVPPLEAYPPENMSPMQAEFYAECKRVSNAKAKERLGYNFHYPTYREGLKVLI